MANVNYLADRAELVRQTRDFFDSRGFLEIQPPCLSRDCVVDAYLDPIQVDARALGIADPRLPSKLFLQTSPESAMKRLLAAGAPSIYSIGPVFRSGESGSLHNIEFSMLEWYEVGGDIESAIGLTGELARSVLAADGYETITYREAFRERIDLDPIAAPIAELRAILSELDTSMAATIPDDRDDLLDALLSAVIAPQLGMENPTVLTEYPLSQAALAKPSTNDPMCAARFELFYRGVEIANGYDELLDAKELQRRYEENNLKRVAGGRDQLLVETTLLAAMRTGLPQCSGVALGVDRLLMLCVGAGSIEEVMPFSIGDA